MEKRFNIVLLTVDALRYDHVGFNGYGRNVSPRVDRLAKGGVIFDNIFSNGPCTPPAFAGIFTGIFPFDKGGYSPLPRLKKTIAEILRDAGYQTAGFSSNPLISHYFNYQRGFMKYFDSMVATTRNPIKRTILGYFEKSGERSNTLLNRLQELPISKTVQTKIKTLFYRTFFGTSIKYYLRARRITARAVRWIKHHYLLDPIVTGNERKPLFLWIHYMDTHDPFMPRWKDVRQVGAKITKKEFEFIAKHPEYTDMLKKRGQKGKLIDLYDAEIPAVDDRIARLMRLFRNKGLYNSTIFVFTADHGEEFKEHGDFGHRAHLYNELLHVPFAIWGGPVELGEVAGLVPGTRIRNLGSLEQVSPTILDILGLPNHPGHEIGSILNKDPAAAGLNYIMAFTYHKGIEARFNRTKDPSIKKLISVQDDRYKYIFNSENGLEELYDLIDDPAEFRNIAESNINTSKYREICMPYIDERKHIQKKTEALDAVETLKIQQALHRLKGRL